MATKNNTEKYIKIAILLVVLGAFCYVIYLPFKKKKEDDTAEEQQAKNEAEKINDGSYKTLAKIFKEKSGINIDEKGVRVCDEIAFKLHKTLSVTQIAGLTLNWNWFDQDDETIKQLKRIKFLGGLQVVNYFFKIHRKDTTTNVAKEVFKHLGIAANEKNLGKDMMLWLNKVKNQAS